MKYILMTGVEFHNQGAYLMMRAMADQIRNRFNATPVVGFGNGSSTQKMLAGVSSLVPFDPYWRSGKIGSPRVLRDFKDKLPFVFPSQITAVFDGSGFAFADQWADRDLSRRADFFEFWSSHNRPVYLLPQAFGPFELSGEPSLRVLTAAKRVFARDPMSLSYLQGLDRIQVESKVAISPDFTSLLKVDDVSVDSRLVGGVPIVPNWNIYERAESETERTAYLQNLVALVTEIKRAGMSPFGLCHEGEKDERLLKMLAKHLESDFRIVSGLNGIELKKVISLSKFIVTGRYHALASALSTGVPAIVHSWSHKYRFLAEEYGVGRLLADPVGEKDENLKVLDTVLADYDDLVETIRAGLSIQMERSRAMWASVAEDFVVPMSTIPG